MALIFELFLLIVFYLGCLLVIKSFVDFIRDNFGSLEDNSLENELGSPSEDEDVSSSEDEDVPFNSVPFYGPRHGG